MAQPEQSRTVLSVSGPDAHGFLQKLVTQNVSKAKDLAYTALLTPQGKYLADFFILEKDNVFLIDIATTHAPALYQRLSMYKLRADVTINETDIAVTCGLGALPEGGFADPRHVNMGWRAYGNTKAGSDEHIDWPALRCDLMIPETGIELTPDTYILEAAFEALNGVDFKKGCYVGQEVTARMKHKTTLRKGLSKVRVTGNPAIGTPIEKDGKAVGTVFTNIAGKGISYLRFDRADGPMNAGTAVIERV